MLDLDMKREGAPTKDAATIILVRDGRDGLEIFCVERSKQSRFMGGAIVFPGGKLDAEDASDAWEALVTAPCAADRAEVPFTKDAAHLRALAVAACRETLEEAAMLPLAAGAAAGDDELLTLRAKLESEPQALREFLKDRSARLDLSALRPLSRWITPVAESRRFDARFYVAEAPAGQSGAHDQRETISSFWARPSEVLRRFESGEVQLMPPTHRTTWLLRECARAADALELAAKSCLDPICPRLVRHVDGAGETLALVLPGDPEHDVKVARVPGPSRYVLRGERWLPEDAPR